MNTDMCEECGQHRAGIVPFNTDPASASYFTEDTVIAIIENGVAIDPLRSKFDTRILCKNCMAGRASGTDEQPNKPKG